MNSRNVSRYKNNSLASGKKHIYARLFDYFSYAVISYIIFIFAFMVSSSLPSYLKLNEDLSHINEEGITFVDSTHLQRKKSDINELIAIEVMGSTYITNITKTSAYIHNIDYPVKQSDGTYLNLPINKEETFINDLISYDLDNLSYYYKLFKKEHDGLNNYVYEGIDYSSDINTFLYKKIMEYIDSNWIEETDPNYIARGEGASRYVILNYDNTVKMINRVAKGETIDSEAVALYNSLFNKYVIATEYGIDDIENNSTEYITMMNKFEGVYQKISGVYALTYFISYVLSFILINLIVSLRNKEPSSLGNRVMKLGMCDKNELEIPLWKYILYYLINFLLGFSSIIVGLMLMGSIGITSLLITPHITLLALLISILTLNIISLFMPLFTKHKHDLSTLLLGIFIKDKNEYDVAPINEALLEENSDDNGK